MRDSLRYKLHSGKPNKLANTVKNFAGLMVPDAWYRHRLQKKLREAKLRPDYEYICRRVDYYNKLSEPWKVSDCNYEKREPSYFHYTGPLNGYRRSVFCTAYYFDQHDVTRWFPPHLRWNFCPGDVYFTPRQPTVVKSRLLVTSNHNSVILKLDKLRHFMFVHDKKSFREKKDMAIFRGKIRESRVRELFMRMYFGHPMCDCGIVGKNDKWPRKWSTPKKTISEHLDYKFIMAMEGNDVASNLKWVMSSNSIAVMTHPTCETWFMEGTLIPNYHYIEVRDDFSDLPEKLQYYIDHPEEAERIIRNAHEYVAQFWDKEREELIGLMVMQRYFETSGQL